MKRAIERNIVLPPADLVATDQVRLGEFIRIDRSSTGEITFMRQAEGALVPVLLKRYGRDSVRHVEARADRVRLSATNLNSARGAYKQEAE